MLTIHLPTFPILVTPRLVLRDLRPTDAGRVFQLRSDARVMEHVSRPLARSLEDATALIELISATVAATDAVQWAITLKGSDDFAGLIGFWRMEKADHRAELGYMLMHDLWGRGIISEAIGAVVDHGLGTLGFHKVEAITRPVNTASIRALEKNGFQREGLLRESIYWNGTYHDALHFGRLAR